MLRILASFLVISGAHAVEITLAPENDPLTDATHELVWATLPWEFYTVEYANDAGGPWNPLTTAIKGDGTLFRYSFGLHLDSRLFRVRSESTQQTAPAPEGYSLIPAGTFTMGSPEDELGRQDDERQHEVTISRAFYMKQTEVTVGEVVDVMNWAVRQGLAFLVNGSVVTVRNGHVDETLLVKYDRFYTVKDDLLVTSAVDAACGISWKGALAYCYFQSLRLGLEPANTIDTFEVDFDSIGYRLPTEAEWEYACRAGTKTPLYSGDLVFLSTSILDPNLDKIAWYAANSPSEFSWPGIAKKQPNLWTLFDISGNRREWCYDVYDRYQLPSVKDPKGGEFTSGERVVRGGGRFDSSSSCRCANRATDVLVVSKNDSRPSLERGLNSFRPVRLVSRSD